MGRRKKYKPEDFNGGFEPLVYKGLCHYKGTYKFRIGYETEEIPYIIECHYTPDFILEFKDGRKIYIEAKGYFRTEQRSKMIHVKRCHPDKDIRMLFMKDERIRGTKSRYSDWCKRHGFPFAIGEIPEEWFK